MRLAGLLIAMVVVSACGGGRQPAATVVTGPTPVATQPPAAPTPSDPDPTPRVPPVTTVSGIVLDFQTAGPVAGAVIGFAPDGSREAPVETAVTDAKGRYTLITPPRGKAYSFVVNDVRVGRGYPQSSNYRADVAVDRGNCIARYGMVLDSKTYLPIVGATAHSLSNVLRATTDKDGWYHMDWGCGVGHLGFNTRWDVMSHPDYLPAQFAGGRGIGGALREDVLLTRK